MKTVPPAVAQFLVQERRQNTKLRGMIDRLKGAAQEVFDQAQPCHDEMSEVPTALIGILGHVLREWEER